MNIANCKLQYSNNIIHFKCWYLQHVIFNLHVFYHEDCETIYIYENSVQWQRVQAMQILTSILKC